MKNSSSKKIKDYSITEAYRELGKAAYWANRNPGVEDPRNQGLTKALMNRIAELRS
jgi:hypothetical protein